MVKENDIITDGTTKWKVRRLGGSSDGNPVGTIIMYAANTMPEGYLLCDGSAVSRTNYAELFKVIGTTWGAGDGSTTFNLPNAVGRFPEGAATAGGYIEAGLPNITATFTTVASNNHNGSGAIVLASQYNTRIVATGQNDTWGKVLDFNAYRSSLVYGSSTTVQPPTIIYRHLIKYI